MKFRALNLLVVGSIPTRPTTFPSSNYENCTCGPLQCGSRRTGFKARAATLEAVLRSSSPDSVAFQNATEALLVVNEELARCGALK
jgi:hypothetical protein